MSSADWRRLLGVAVLACGPRTACGAAIGDANACRNAEPVATFEVTAQDPYDRAREYLGQGIAASEGQDPDHAPWFGGIYADPDERGVVIVAVTHPCLVDEAELAAVVGDAHVRVVETALGRDETYELRDSLGVRLGSHGIRADRFIESTTRGLVIRVITPTPDLVTDEVVGDVPSGLVTVEEGEVSTDD